MKKFYDEAVTQIARKTMAYLDPNKLVDLFNKVRGNCVQDSISDYQTSKLSLFEAIGNRNAIQMIKTGQNLLVFEDQLNNDDYNLVVSSILLGYIKSNQYKPAQNFYINSVQSQERIYGKIAPEKLLLSLIQKNIP